MKAGELIRILEQFSTETRVRLEVGMNLYDPKVTAMTNDTFYRDIRTGRIPDDILICPGV